MTRITEDAKHLALIERYPTLAGPDEVLELVEDYRREKSLHEQVVQDWAGCRETLELAEATLGAIRALCEQAERNYGGPVSMARVEAWVHLGALRTVLDRYPLPEETS